MGSGALVFTDEMSTPMPSPPIDGRHLIVYDNEDEQAFMNKLRYYITHPDQARAIATRGLKHCLRYHLAVSRVDFLLRSAHELTVLERRATLASNLPLTYSSTGRSLKHANDSAIHLML